MAIVKFITALIFASLPSNARKTLLRTERGARVVKRRVALCTENRGLCKTRGGHCFLEHVNALCVTFCARGYYQMRYRLCLARAVVVSYSVRAHCSHYYSAAGLLKLLRVSMLTTQSRVFKHSLCSNQAPVCVAKFLWMIFCATLSLVKFALCFWIM